MFLGNSSFIVPRKYPDIIAGSALLIQQISKGVLLEKVKPDVFKGLSDMEYKSVSLSRPWYTRKNDLRILSVKFNHVLVSLYQNSYFLVLLMAAYIRDR